MIAGSTPSSLLKFVSLGSRVARGCGPLALGAVLLLSVACSDKKPASAPAPAASSATGSMFQNMKNGKPLPRPPTEEGGEGAPPGAAMPALAPGGAENPECKALAEEEKGIRAQVEALNRDVVGPASDKAEAANDEFQACQDDAGCVGDLDRYKVKQSAAAAARRAEEAAEKQLLDFETRLHDISEKMAAKCDDGI